MMEEGHRGEIEVGSGDSRRSSLWHMDWSGGSVQWMGSSRGRM